MTDSATDAIAASRCCRAARRLAGVAVAVAVLATGVTAAQAQDWHAEVQAGQIQALSEIAHAASDTLLAGIRFDHPAGGLRVSTGVPTGADSPLWAALGGWRRFALRPRRGVIVGADASGHAFALRDRDPRAAPVSEPSADPAPAVSGYALVGQVLPGVGYESRAFQIHGRSGLSTYWNGIGEGAYDRAVWLSDVRAAFAPVRGVALVPAVRHVRDRAAGYTHGSITGMAAHPRASVWASVGAWVDVPGSGVPWAAGGTLRLHPRVALSLGTRRDSFDPLYLRAPFRTWHAGLSFRLGGSRPPPPLAPAARPDGRTTIRLPGSLARSQPRVAGDFTDWQPRPMTRDGGAWIYEVSLPAGVYHYAFVGADDRWFVPEQTPGRREDGMGGHVAVLVVAP